MTPERLEEIRELYGGCVPEAAELIAEIERLRELAYRLGKRVKWSIDAAECLCPGKMPPLPRGWRKEWEELNGNR